MPEYETKKVFAQNLAYLLEINQETQAELASAMGVACSSVSGWCAGTKMPRMDKIEWLANHFGVARTALLLPNGVNKSKKSTTVNTDELSTLTERQKNFYKRISSMTEEELDRLESIIELLDGKKK